MTTRKAAKFTNGSIMRHVAVSSFTASIGLMAIYAVDLIDLIFISMLGYEEMAAAAGYASALMFFTSAVNIGLSVAAGVLISRSIGEDEELEAREYATSTAMLVILTGLVIPIALLVNVEFFVGLLGASGQVAELAATYLWIVLPFTWMSGLSMLWRAPAGQVSFAFRSADQRGVGSDLYFCPRHGAAGRRLGNCGRAVRNFGPCPLPRAKKAPSFYSTELSLAMA